MRHPTVRFPSRVLHHRLTLRRERKVRAQDGLPLLAVLGPGLLAGLSDDDPAGITTYAVLGSEQGYRMLWVLALATVALIVFHELGARMGLATGKGLVAVIRERQGVRIAGFVAAVLVVANTGTMCAELAGVALGAQMLGGIPPIASVPVACVVLGALVLGESFARIEHVLLALTAIFAAYVVSGLLAHPDWGATAKGLVVPTLPDDRRALYLAVATIGTTLAPWGLAFIQSYAADKRLPPSALRYERIDVISGAVLTGVIGAFVVMASAATLHGTRVDDATDLAEGLRPLAGDLAPTIFAAGFLGAALLAAAVVPLSTAFSVSEAAGRRGHLDDTPREAPVFYGAFLAVTLVAAVIVVAPGSPLLTILVASQALNAVLLLAVLPLLITAASDRGAMATLALGRAGRTTAWLLFALIAASVVALGVLA
ncbi:MAG: Nramp family divalent metal transporter [Patulibacter minatonensis]